MPRHALAESLMAEQRHLAVADQHILDGYARLLQQRKIVARLRASGGRIEQAERLIEVTSRTLAEWKQQRDLIALWIRYLQAQARSEAKPL
jgi:hypothetical protein